MKINQLATTTDALRNAARAIQAEADKLAGFEPSALKRELDGLATFLRLSAGNDGDGNSSCSLTFSI